MCQVSVIRVRMIVAVMRRCHAHEPRDTFTAAATVAPSVDVSRQGSRCRWSRRRRPRQTTLSGVVLLDVHAAAALQPDAAPRCRGGVPTGCRSAMSFPALGGIGRHLRVRRGHALTPSAPRKPAEGSRPDTVSRCIDSTVC